MAFSFVQKLWREKANKLISMCLPRHYTAPMERHISPEISKTQGLFWSNCRLQATWHSKARQRATSLSAVQLAFAFVVFRIPSVTCSLTRALSQSLAHAQQLFSASTPSQILAPRVCTFHSILQFLSLIPHYSTYSSLLFH